MAAGSWSAVITVSGSPDFFDSLDRLRQGALLTGAVVLVILILMGVLLHRISLSLERYRATMLRQENLAAMGRMTAGIAHEIRNPLGIIRGSGQHLQRVLAEAGITDEVADFIPEEVDRLDAILGGYLAFGADSSAASEVVDLARVVRRSAGLLKEELARDKVSLDMAQLADGLLVEGDPRRLQQVLLNLLLNASDAMPGGGEVSLQLDRTERLGQAADQGSGSGAGNRTGGPAVRTVLHHQGKGKRPGPGPEPPDHRGNGRLPGASESRRTVGGRGRDQVAPAGRALTERYHRGQHPGC